VRQEEISLVLQEETPMLLVEETLTVIALEMKEDIQLTEVLIIL
jgi:hypothetical protein